MNKKRISINIIANFLSFFIGLAITFFLTPYIIEVLGVEAYSFFPMANTVISYTSIITMAVNSMVGRFISIAYHKGEIHKAESYFNTVLVTDIVLAILLFIISTITVTYLDDLINIPTELVADVKLLFFILFFASMLLLSLSAFKVCTFVKNRIDIDAYLNIIKSIVRTAMLLVLFAFFSPSITYVGLASCVIFSFEALFYVRVKKKIMPNIRVNFSKYNFQMLNELLKPGMWNSLGQVNKILTLGLDLVFANIFLGAVSSGILGVAKTIPAYAYTLCNIIAISFTPALTKAYAKNKDTLYGNLTESFIPLCLLGALVYGGFISMGDLFYSLWIPDTPSKQLHILSILTMAPTIALFGVLTIKSVFVVQNNVKINAIVNSIVALLACILVLTLLKFTDLGLYAIAGVSSVLFIIKDLVFTLPYIARCMNKKWYSFYPKMFKSWICISTVAVVGWFFRSQFIVNTWKLLICSALLIAIISVVINLFIITNKEQRCKLKSKLINWLGKK